MSMLQMIGSVVGAIVGAALNGALAWKPEPPPRRLRGAERRRARKWVEENLKPYYNDEYVREWKERKARQRKARAQFAGIGVLVFVIAPCFLLGWLANPRSVYKLEAKAAVWSLRRVGIATRTGVDRVEYQRLLVEARADVDTALATLDRGQLYDALAFSIVYYEMLGEEWDRCGNMECSSAALDDWRQAQFYKDKAAIILGI